MDLIWPNAMSIEVPNTFYCHTSNKVVSVMISFFTLHYFHWEIRNCI
jgi:hypothetical protein